MERGKLYSVAGNRLPVDMYFHVRFANDAVGENSHLVLRNTTLRGNRSKRVGGLLARGADLRVSLCGVTISGNVAADPVAARDCAAQDGAAIEAARGEHAAPCVRGSRTCDGDR